MEFLPTICNATDRALRPPRLTSQAHSNRMLAGRNRPRSPARGLFMANRVALVLIILPFLAGILAAPAWSRGEFVRIGDTVFGKLGPDDPVLEEDKRFYDEFILDCNLGKVVTITLHSNSIDSYLTVTGPDGTEWENDDYSAASGNDSRISILVREPGYYKITCTSYSQETGPYELSVEERIRPTYFGLFIGIENYGSEWVEAPMCDEDAEGMFDAFLVSGLMREEDGIVLTNRDAKLDNLKEALDELNGRMNENDVFIFFFSGHGKQMPIQEGAESQELDGLDECLVLRDWDLTDDELAEMLANVNAGLTVVVLDACNSGGIASDIVNRPGIACFASSEEDILSDYASDFGAGGYLSVFFREAILGYADLDGDRIIMMGELTRFLLHRYYDKIPDAKLAMYGYQELVHLRGLVTQDTILCWWPPEEDRPSDKQNENQDGGD